ncbi:MAG: hypothetical protein K0V04_17730 [Deltaproteobacteria bacterium]|nr:hypothetical protein [Deltaproteobacteria bacterium]
MVGLIGFAPWRVLAFAAGEYALCGFAYLVAHTLVGRTDAWTTRLRALWPAALAVTAFAVVSVAMAAGVHGATSYVDPLTQPGPSCSRASIECHACSVRSG